MTMITIIIILRELPARTSSWGCAREGRVGTEVRVVGYGRVDKIRCFVSLFRPRGTPKSHLRIRESGAKKLSLSTPHEDAHSKNCVISAQEKYSSRRSREVLT